jgi:PAS domain S-box-containing protein
MNEPQQPAIATSQHAGIGNEELSRRNKDQLYLALGSARMGTWDWYLLDRSMHWDERMHALFGLAPSTFGGRYEQFLDMIHAENRQQVAREFAQAVESLTEYEGEFRVVWPTDGSVHTLRARSKAVCDNQGKPVLVTGVSWDVSERSQMENALARERFLLKTLMDTLPDHIYFKDRESRFIAVNRATATLFGFEDPADVLGKTDADLFAREHARAALHDEQEILRMGQPLVNMEEKETWPDGHETWVSTSKLPLRDPSGHIIGTFGLSRDITEKKRAEEKLAATSKELTRLNRILRTLYQCNHALIHATDEHELLQSVCEILVKVGGIRLAWVGVCEDDAQKTVRPVAMAGYGLDYVQNAEISWSDQTERGRGPTGISLRTGKPYWARDMRTDPTLAPWRDAATARQYASCVALPLIFSGIRIGAMSLYARQLNAFNETTIDQYTDLANNLAYGVAALRTQAERKRAEEALHNIERRLQDIVDNSTALIFVKDLELKYQLINREIELRHGVQRNLIRGKSDFDIYPPGIAERLRANDRQVIETGKPIEFEETVPADDGDRFYITSKFLLRDASGKPYALCGIATDITERKRTEIELRRTEEAMREAQTALIHVSRVTMVGELAASIAHELNQPLTGVVTNSNACLRWLGNDPPNLNEGREAVMRILRDGTRAADVITRIRSLLRKTEVELAAMDINDAIREVIALIQPELRKNGVKLRIDLDPALPPVQGDRVLLQQVVLNLLINAIEAMASVDWDDRNLQMISRRAEPPMVLVAVRDSGPGLGKHSFEDISKAFFTTKPNGMGMGLSISRSIVKNHGGRLWAEPNPDRGATFQLTLRLNDEV